MICRSKVLEHDSFKRTGNVRKCLGAGGLWMLADFGATFVIGAATASNSKSKEDTFALQDIALIVFFRIFSNLVLQ